MNDGTNLPTATSIFRRKRVHMAGDPRELIAHLRDLDSKKKDFLATDSKTTLNVGSVPSVNAKGKAVETTFPQVRLETKDEVFEVPFMEKALAQLSDRFKVGRPYTKRMADEAPELFATNFNWWLERSKRKTLWRTFAGKVRAVLSQKFKIFDNSDVAMHALKAALEHSQKYNTDRGMFNPDGSPLNTVELFGWQADADGLHMWLVDTTVVAHLPTMDLDPNVAKYVNGALRGTYMGEQYEENGTVERMAIAQGRDTTKGGTLVFPIVEISNHEGGSGKLKVIPGCGISVCSNVAKVGVDFARIHVGEDIGKNAEEILSHETRRHLNQGIYMVVEDAVRSAFDPKVFAENVAKLKKTMEVELTDSVDAIDIVVKSEGLSDEDRDNILAAFAPKVAPDKTTLYDVAMAVTEAAQSYEGDKLTQFQDIAGYWIADQREKVTGYSAKYFKSVLKPVSA